MEEVEALHFFIRHTSNKFASPFEIFGHSCFILAVQYDEQERDTLTVYTDTGFQVARRSVSFSFRALHVDLQSCSSF
jgi:hypothetical protein